MDKNDDVYTIYCEDCGSFEIRQNLLYNRIKQKTIVCTNCNKINSYNISGLETQLSTFIKEIYDGEILYSTRKIITPYELDIYLPELKLAFEFNGLYWHNEINKDKYYHLNKTNMCLDRGVDLFHIYEDDWKYKTDIIKSMIIMMINKKSKL